MKSILIPVIAGYLIQIRGFDKSWQRQYVLNEAQRVAAKIRDAFGTFDESDREKCATVVRAIMNAPTPRELEAKKFWKQVS